MGQNLFKKIFSLLIIFTFAINGFVFARKEGMTTRKTEEVLPPFEFIQSTKGAEIKGEIKIEGKIKDANSVEFYYQSTGAILAVYLGKGERKGEDLWQYSWNSNSTPNGDYEIFAKIINQYGEYKSEKIKITIDNPPLKDEKKEEELKIGHQQIKEEIEKREKEIFEERQRIGQEISETLKTKENQKEVEEGVGELIEKVKEVSQAEKDIEKIKEVEKKQEEKVKNFEKELKKIQQIPELQRKILEEEKKNQIETEKVEKQKTQEEIVTLKQKLERKTKEKEKVKEDILERIKPEEKEKISAKLENLEGKVKEKEKNKIEREEILLKDSDSDGLSDEFELWLETDPFNPDSDGDGFLDGVEYKTGYSPLKPGSADKIIYQDPQKVLPKKSDVYRVEKIEKVTLPSSEIGLKFSGKGLPNSFVTLYIFSVPIVVAVKTNSNGYWEYTLDKPLTDGEHRVYAALTNNHGQVEARSETFVFVKTGEKIFRIFEIQAEAVSPVQTLQKPFIILILAIIILALAIALIIISLLTKKKIEKIKRV